MRVALARILSGVVDLFYPERCLNCGAFGTLLCPQCHATISPATDGPRCPMCSARWDAGTPGAPNCPRCLHMDAVDRVHAAADLEGAARRVVHALKYRGIRSAATIMSSAVRPLAEEIPVDATFAVPLHRARQRQRGFNQSQLIVDALRSIPPAGSLVRTKDTNRQVGMHLGERRSNVAGAFAYAGPSLAGKTIAVLDDVVTTGATANECARVLRDHGARRVLVFAYARANYNPAAAREPLFD